MNGIFLAFLGTFLTFFVTVIGSAALFSFGGRSVTTFNVDFSGLPGE